MDEATYTDNAVAAEQQGLPHSREAEEAVLGAVLIDPESYLELSQILHPDDFYILRNRWIWEAFFELHEQRVPIDYLTVSQELEKAARLGEIGGAAYLMSLINQTPTSLHAQNYASMVEQFSVRRKMLAAANQLAQMAFNQQRPVDKIIDEAEQSIFSLSQHRITHDLKPINALMSEFYDHTMSLTQRDEEYFGVPTGLIDLDRLLGGMQKSDLLIVAGRPGSGKTGFLLSAAKNAAQKHRKNVAVFSLEMSNEQLIQRLIAQETGIDSQRLRMGKLNHDEFDTFTEACEMLSNSHMLLDDTPAITPMQLLTKCRRQNLETPLDLIIIDYIQLMSGGIRTDNRVQEVSYITRNLKILARELNVPVLAAAQLSRAVEHREDKLPVLSDLRESGSLEQDADIVMFIHRPDLLDEDAEKSNKARIIVAKHRNGPISSGIEIVFRPNLARFENAAPKGR